MCATVSGLPVSRVGSRQGDVDLELGQVCPEGRGVLRGEAADEGLVTQVARTEASDAWHTSRLGELPQTSER